MNSPFIGLGIFSFLSLFGLSFVIDALRRKPRKAKKEFNWGKKEPDWSKLDEYPGGSIFDDEPKLARDNHGRFVGKNAKIEE